ncbi:hypothetical protein LO80_03200 [Candidatus Francisella endociliophora]|uniref:DUF2335 domain-containing protein n=1 Tax=Candidatus Francisella endociliophora TaxID=653937 RepID=A0A097END3_9GAMM|nr:hypothetical protein [Francisella sp. FSC1006]AIT09076.1 hypothetical protein LO80_03200 [Francisella sp. FSC1006]
MSKSNQPFKNNNQKQLLQRTEVHSSILPPASEMEKLKSVDHRLVDTYIEFVNKQHIHQIECDKEKLAISNRQIDTQQTQLQNVNQEFNKDVSLKKLALWLSFVTIIILSMLSTFLIYNDNIIAGSIFASPAIVSIIGGFIGIVIDRYKKSKKNDNK